MWLWLWVLIFIPWVVWGKTCGENPIYCPWVVYYGDSAPSEIFKNFDPIVLDPDASQTLAALAPQNKMLYGYISLGEVGTSRSYFSEVQEKGLLLNENPNWAGSFFIDVRKEPWTRLVLDKLIPEMIVKGFKGIFLDTLDSAIHLEESDPVQYAGMKKAAAQLVQLIRVYFPSVHIMMNRAFALLPEVGESIHIVVGESIYTTYNFNTKTYEHVPQQQYEHYVKLLQQAAATFPHLQIFSLDYWYVNQPEEIKRIYAIERKNGFRPYVSLVNLDRVIPEPK